MKLRALTVEQAAIIASGQAFSEAVPDFFKLDDFNAFAENFFELDSSNEGELTSKERAECLQGKLGRGECLQVAHVIYNALIQEAELALFNSNTLATNGQPETVLKLFNKRHEPKNCTFTRKSIALWFYENGSLEKALLIYPEFEPPEAIKTREEELHERFIRFFHENRELKGVIGGLRAEIKALQAENEALKNNVEPSNRNFADYISNYPVGIQAAVRLYEDCWMQLPSDTKMKAPSKEQLVAYAKSELKLKVKATIEAVIKLSKPEGEGKGGYQKTGRVKPWRQRKDI